MWLWIFLGIIHIAIHIAIGSPYTNDVLTQYDYDEDTIDVKHEKEVMVTPQFLSTKQELLVNEGDTIRLPCIVDRLEGFVLLWKKNMNIIAVSSQIIDKRVSVDESSNGNHLVIKQASSADEGVYTCQVSAYTPTQLSHTVTIRVKPVISTIPEDVLIVTAGSTARLECKVLSGSPVPDLIWRREGRKMPTGEEEIVGSILMFTTVSRHHTGDYICMADNGYRTSPVEKKVRLEVQYAPEIDVEDVVIETKYGEEEEIVCTIHASPHATLTWKKDGVTVDTQSSNTMISRKHNHHKLTILAVDENTMGNYTCLANNSMGEEMKTVEVTGIAREAIITSNIHGEESNTYTLTWYATSRSTVTEFQVLVRKADSADWDIYDVEAKHDDEEDKYHGLLYLKDLQEATPYEAKVAAKNRFGISQPRNAFLFGTRGADVINRHSAMTGATPPIRITRNIFSSFIITGMILSRMTF